jgi:hypothetical protein
VQNATCLIRFFNNYRLCIELTVHTWSPSHETTHLGNPKMKKINDCWYFYVPKRYR